MIVRKLGSPALPLLGVLTFVVPLGLSVYYTIQDLDVAYVRWPDIDGTIRWLIFFAGTLVGISAAYNAASLTAPHVITNTGLGKVTPFGQLIRVAACLSLSANGALVLGQLPLIVRATSDNKNFSVEFLFTVMTCIAFTFSIALIAVVVGRTLRSFPATIAAIVTAPLSYFVLIVATSGETFWAIIPVRAGYQVRYKTFNDFNYAVPMLMSFALAIALALLVWFITQRGKHLSTLGGNATAFAGILIIAASLVAVQSSIGRMHETNKDVCQRSANGSEICVSEVDQLALQSTVDEVDALFGSAPVETPPVQMGEINSMYIMENPESEYFRIVGDERRADLTDLALQIVGIASCTDALSEGAMVSERVAAHLIDATGAYSANLEKYGYLYKSVDENGEIPEAYNPLDQVNYEDAQVFLNANWDAISSCQALTRCLIKYLDRGDSDAD